jgi:hypothetical protein
MEFKDIRIGDMYSMNCDYECRPSRHELHIGDSVKVVGKCKNFGTVIAIAGDKFGDSWEIEPESLEPYGDFDKDSIYAKLHNQDIEHTARYFKQLFGCAACAYHSDPEACYRDDRCAHGFIEFLKGRIA